MDKVTKIIIFSLNNLVEHKSLATKVKSSL